MNDDLEQTLRDGFVAPPPDFSARVMAALPAQPIAAHRQPLAVARELVEWFAVAGAVLTGLAQLIPLLFGIWTFSVAG